MTDETGVFPLIHTKLQRPRLSEGLVPRRRLLDRLNAGLDQKLTLISAQAGAGKTTLLAQWLEECPQPSAWLSLDEHDNDLMVFVSYLIGAVRTVFPDACERTFDLLKAPQFPPPRVITTSLVNDLDDLGAVPSQKGSRSLVTSKKSLILVLDDYQTITEPAIHGLLSDLIKYLPHRIHLVLASRSDPPLPIAKLQARGEMTHLRFLDLRFTPEEAHSFLQTAVGSEVSIETAALLEEKSEGWITGLKLAALSMRMQSANESFVGRFKGASNPMLIRYFVSEVIAKHSPTIQKFALCISILNRFCAPLCEALTDISATESQEIIEWKVRANLFLVPLDGESKWYRYHHLFRDLLRQKLEHQRSSEEIATLHIRASKWFNQNGFVEEAINHALSAGDMDQVAQLVEGHYHEELDRESWRVLKRWLDLFPRQLIEKRVRLLITEAWVFGFFHKFDEVAANLEQIKAILDQGAPDLSEEEAIVLSGEIATLWSIVHYWMGQGQLSLENAIRAIDVTPPEHAFVLGNARCYLICAHQLLGQLDKAHQ
jgi:LuxR family maltose regulon positive regulatory protein